VEILQNKKYAFSTDNESTAKAKALAIQKYKMQGSRIDREKEKALESSYIGRVRY